MKAENLDFAAAVQYLAAKEGMIITEHSNTHTPASRRQRQPLPPRTIDIIPPSAVASMLQNYQGNHLYNFLAATYGHGYAADIFQRYGAGSVSDLAPVPRYSFSVTITGLSGR